jgi:tripartite-type tricarboxylate transporter receptor subunit TctC
MSLRKFLLTASALAFAFACAPAVASDFPNRPVTIVVPYPAGSSADMIPRLLGPLLSKELNGVPIVIENKPGANGSIGAARVATAEADGYTILLATTGMMAINQWIYAKPLYSPEKDFIPITNGAVTPNMIVVNPTVKATTLKELVALAKAQPGMLSFSSAGIGSTSHICGEALKVIAGVNIVHVPYQGAAPALQDVLGGRVSMICDNFSNAVEHVRSGKLTGIAVTAKTRNDQLPQVPSSAESGFPDLLAGNWYGFVAPAATPKPIVERLNKALLEALRDPSVVSRLQNVGLSVVAGTPEEFKATITADAARMEKIVRQSQAKMP